MNYRRTENSNFVWSPPHPLPPNTVFLAHMDKWTVRPNSQHLSPIWYDSTSWRLPTYYLIFRLCWDLFENNVTIIARHLLDVSLPDILMYPNLFCSSKPAKVNEFGCTATFNSKNFAEHFYAKRVLRNPFVLLWWFQMYPSKAKQINNVVEASRKVKVDNWCRFGRKHWLSPRHPRGAPLQVSRYVCSSCDPLKIKKKRMQSSRMRNFRCSGHN